MQQLHPDLWICDSPLRFLGLEVGARMTVMRLPDSKLLLHSPIAPSEELVREVKALGEVTFLIAPNRFHHLFVGDWQREFPAALAYAAPGLDKKRPDLNISGVLSSTPEPGWADTVDQILFEGFPLASEVVFFHRPSRTLVATDLAFNIGAESPALTRLVFRMSKAYGTLSSTLLEKLFVRDKAAFRRSMERMFEWPFERVVVAHGNVCETGGREQLVRAYDWILGSADAAG